MNTKKMFEVPTIVNTVINFRWNNLVKVVEHIPSIQLKEKNKNMFKRTIINAQKNYLKFITQAPSDANRNFNKCFNRIIDILKKSENDHHFDAVKRMINQFSLLYPTKKNMVVTLETLWDIEFNRYNKQNYRISPMTQKQIKELDGKDWRSF